MKVERFVGDDEAKAIEVRPGEDAVGGTPRPFSVFHCDDVQNTPQYGGRFRTWAAACHAADAYVEDGDAVGLVMVDEPFRGGTRRRVGYRVTRE